MRRNAEKGRISLKFGAALCKLRGNFGMKLRVMTGSGFRAFCVAGVFALWADGARADSAAQTSAAVPLDLTGYSTTADFDIIAPRARLAGQLDLGPSDTMDGLSLGPAEFAQARTLDVAGHMALLNGVSLDFGAGADLAGRFNSYDAAGTKSYDGLFFSGAAVNSPYASLTNGGSFVESTVDISDRLHLSFGASSLAPGMGTHDSPTAAIARLGGLPDAYDTRSAGSLLGGMSLDIAPWGGLGFTASKTSEHDGLLGSFDPSVRSADTSALGVSARVRLGDGWMTTASFADAITKLDLKPGNAAALHTRSYGFAVAKSNLFGNDAMGFAVMRPAGGAGDTPEFALAPGQDSRSQLLPEQILFDGQAPETDFELGYVTTFLDGSVALQTNAAYQMNFAGQTGNNAVSFLSRAKIKF